MNDQEFINEIKKNQLSRKMEELDNHVKHVVRVIRAHGVTIKDSYTIAIELHNQGYLK